MANLQKTKTYIFKKICASIICLILAYDPAWTLSPPLLTKPIQIKVSSEELGKSTGQDDAGNITFSDVFDDTDKAHMIDILKYAKHEIDAGSLDPELPVVARIVDRHGNTVVTSSRKVRDIKSRYGVNAFHAEVQAIREAEARGFKDWSGATMYTNLESCYNCSKALTEYYGFGRVVYGLKDTTLEESDDYTAGYKRENVVLAACDDKDITAQLETLFAVALQKQYNQPSVKPIMHATGLKVSGAFRELLRKNYGEDVQIVAFNADLWVEKGRKTPWIDHHGQVKDTEERDMFRHIEWHKQNLNPAKKHLLVIVGGYQHAAEAREKIINDDIFEHEKIIIYEQSPDFKWLESDFTIDPDVDMSQYLGYSLHTGTERRFNNSYTVAAICRAIEKNISLNDREAINNIYTWVTSSPSDDVEITLGSHQVMIDIPKEGLAVRYFDPAEANIVTPYSDLSGLLTKVVSSRLHRQVITRIKALPYTSAGAVYGEELREKEFYPDNSAIIEQAYSDLSENSFSDDDQRNMADLVRIAKEKIEKAELDSRLPVVARIVDKNGNVIATSTRTKLSKPSKYGVKALHAEVCVIREAEAAGFADWANVTMYVLIDSCYTCSRAITEFYPFKRVVYGVEDPTLAYHSRNKEGYADNGVVLVECSDESLQREIRSLFNTIFQNEPRDTPLGREMIAREKEAVKHFRDEYQEIFGEDIQVTTFSADLWAKNKMDKKTNECLFAHLEWFKQDLNPNKKYVLLIIGEGTHCEEARRKIISEGIFKDENILIYKPNISPKAVSSKPVKLAIIAPRSIRGHGETLLNAFGEVGSGLVEVSMEIPGQEETISAFAERIRKSGYDLALVALHGAHNEEPVAFEDFGCDVCLLPIRPGEVLLRSREGTYDREAWNRIFKKARAVILLGKARIPDYDQLSDRVMAVPLGFSKIPDSPARDKHFEEGVVIGARTLWSEMRSMYDIKALVREIRRQQGDGSKTFGYIAGRFDEYAHPETRKIVNEFEELRSSPDCLILNAGKIEEAYKKEGGFNDLASFKRWISDRLKEKGAMVVIVEGDIEDEELRRLEASIFDFSNEMYHEIMQGFAPKDEYSAAIHRNAGQSIAIGFDSDAIRDMKDEGIGIISVQYEDNKADFAAAAKEMIWYITNPSEYYARLERTWNAARNYTTKHMGQQYLDVVIEALHNKDARQDAVKNYADFINKNKSLLHKLLGENKEDTLVRVPIEAIESVGIDNIRDFLETLQTAPNGYVELFYMTGIDEIPGNMYGKYGLEKKELPKEFKRARKNTITLFPAFKGEDIDRSTIGLRLGNVNISPDDTILSPIGLQNDPAGLIRATIFGLAMIDAARSIKEPLWRVKAQKPKEYRALMDRIQTALESYKSVCDPDAPFEFTQREMEDMFGLISGDINSIVRSLNKLIKLLPITPLNAEELRKIYERTRAVLMAA
ncbi:MAG: deaminase [Candidatus Omnitrophota bacterium]